ncbi:MAG: site-2 protease family protein [Pseudomonadota bacterium]|nr:site-2 protease family protein [Pseudomonadota bacterium]
MDWVVPWLGERLVFWIPFVLSLAVHEYAHARAASWLGDNTAESEGRLTLDPFAHIDVLGTVVLPLLGVPIGWAKPVPINPAQFRMSGDGRLAMLFTAAAGPLSNLGIALGCTAAIALLGVLSPTLIDGALGQVLASTVVLNVALALFNLLPIPPLDGSRIVDWLCPEWLRPLWSALYARAGLGIALVLIVPMLLGLDVGGWARTLGQGLIDLAR